MQFILKWENFIKPIDPFISNLANLKILNQVFLFIKEKGMIVRRHLPPDNEMNRRNKKYRQLYDAFDSMDGKPIQHFVSFRFFIIWQIFSMI